MENDAFGQVEDGSVQGGNGEGMTLWAESHLEPSGLAPAWTVTVAVIVILLAAGINAIVSAPVGSVFADLRQLWSRRVDKLYWPFEFRGDTSSMGKGYLREIGARRALFFTTEALPKGSQLVIGPQALPERQERGSVHGTVVACRQEREENVWFTVKLRLRPQSRGEASFLASLLASFHGAGSLHRA